MLPYSLSGDSICFRGSTHIRHTAFHQLLAYIHFDLKYRIGVICVTKCTFRNYLVGDRSASGNHLCTLVVPTKFSSFLFGFHSPYCDGSTCCPPVEFIRGSVPTNNLSNPAGTLRIMRPCQFVFLRSVDRKSTRLNSSH